MVKCLTQGHMRRNQCLDFTFQASLVLKTQGNK